ncbi:hypothetical protein EG329_007267 [Mollisiaceae sp. DMI_Dod_QoI]|nr:hypothetical protein EG329_007267 [Helotiales sp. DMI_Dod_QoI]
MLVSSTKQQRQTVPHPRRLPVHLSVSLRHEGVPASPKPAEIGHLETPGVKISGAPPMRQESEESGRSAESNVQKWFDYSNSRPETGYHRNFEDNDFRSVIDDLTIENKKLRKRLRRYERSQPSHLEKDKLFELKIHSLPSQKRRELEDVLRQFASSIEGSQNEGTNLSVEDQRLPYPTLNPHLSIATTNTRHTCSSTTSNSRPNDSGYASMSTSGPTSTSNFSQRLQLPLEKAVGLQPHVGKEQKIHSFLHDIPEGLLPKHSPVMTERQKKRIVVQRLEQLFTGRKGAKAGENSQPLQQQEVSKSAARADQAVRDGSSEEEEEGTREAHILPMDIDVDSRKPSRLLGESSTEASSSRVISDSSDEHSPERQSPKQRPTRPLDLDPDRAQIPSENIDYIRHLGLSTPRLVTEDSADVAADAEGWIYLNLLINMAQLHIINVTPEFVRSALAAASEKFQLSRDGKKVRWRGGSEGTRFNSDSEQSSARNRSPQDGDNEQGNRKRRKVEVGRFASAPVEVDSDIPMESSGVFNSFHYKPLFHHQNSSSTGMVPTEESDFSFGSGPENESYPRWLSRGACAVSSVSRAGGAKRSRDEDGPIVFYSGAKFCTDLSGDRESIITQLHISGIGKGGYCNQASVALGSNSQKSAPLFVRTTSGSFLPSRPFKDYSKGDGSFQTGEERSKTPELFKEESEDDRFVNELPHGSPLCAHLQTFEASGLAGIQPADHFAVRVQTRRRKLDEAQRTKLSLYSRLSLPGKSPRKFLHSVSKKSIESFHDKSPEEVITDRLAAWPGFSSPPRSLAASSEQLPVKTEILSTMYVNLEPSQLPPPLGWDVTTDSSAVGSDTDSSSSGISRLRRDRTFLLSRSMPRNRMEDCNDLGLADDSGVEDEASDIDTDSNIDMLAQARRLDPDVVAEQERTFAMEIHDRGEDERGTEDVPSVRSSAATVDDESGYSGAVSGV